jgi:hypothetical protein
VQQAVDPVTRANLARLNRLPTEKIASEFLKLPPVQQRLIREYLTRGVTLEDRLRVWDLIESAQVGSSSGSSGGSPRLQQIAHDLVKPLHLLAHTGSDPQVAVRLKRIAASLKDAEEKLGIRPKDDPKDKTDKSKTPAKS